MKRAGMLVYILLVLSVLATAPAAARAAGDTQSRTSQKGAYQADVTVVGGEGLRIGPNSVEIRLRDRTGRPLEGARLTVAPWMADTDSGVWEKPVVSEKGKGLYSADNVSIVRSGRWELKLSVKHGSLEDRIVVSYNVAGKEQQAQPKPAKARGGYSRTVKSYTIPSVTLLNQDGKRVNIKTLVDSGKPVIVNFIYTTCTTICPVLSASFSNLRKDLGPDIDKVQFISISIDPEHDRPEQMKKYLSRFTNQKGWEFLTGSREDITKVLKSFDALVVDKMAHEPIYMLRSPRSEEWVRIKGLTWSSDLMGELKSLGRI